MALMINYGSEMLRINTEKNRIEYSTNQGKTWFMRCSSPAFGDFLDLLPFGNELLAITSKGAYYSKDAGRSWFIRCLNSGHHGDFETLQDNGNELLAQTSKGLYYSKDAGKSWSKKR